MNERGEIVYGPAAATVGGIGAWSSQAVGWAYLTGTQPSTQQLNFRLSDRDGNALTAPVTISPPGLLPSWPVVIWAGGEFAVQYCSEHDSQSACVAMSLRRVDAAGALASPALLLHRDPSGGFSEHDIVRVGGAFFSAWFYGYDVMGSPVRTVSGAWYDPDGQRFTPLTAYYQAPSGETTALWGLAGREDHVALVYSRLPGASTLPAEQLHIDLAGGVVDGPRQIVAEAPGIGYRLSPSQKGLGLHFTYASGTSPSGIYLRRVRDDGLLGSAAHLVQQRTGAGIETGAVSHQGRAYGNLWLEWVSNPGMKDLYFEASPGYELLAAGAGPSPSAAPVAKLLPPESPAGPAVTTVTAYGAGGYGVNVASAAITGDDVDRLLTGPGPGPSYGPQVRAFHYRGPAIPKVNFYAYGTLRYGARPGGGDLDGDAPHEILTTPGPGTVFGPHVRGFQFDDVQVQAMAKVSFFAYGTLQYGANGACGNLDADATREIVTGPGPGPLFASQLRGFQYDNVAVTSMGKINAIVFPAARYGLHVATGDTDWDGYDEVGGAAGPDPAADSRIAVYDFDAATLSEKSGSRFEAFAGALGGARLSFCQWVGEDMNRELLVSRGPLPASTTEARAVDDSAAGFASLASFEPFPGQTHGSTMASIYVGF